jgi:hypothetical protein
MNELDPNAEEKETEVQLILFFGCILLPFLERNCESLVQMVKCQMEL